LVCRFHEELPGSEYDGRLVFTPPLPEHVPLPEFELYFPLLHQDPALAGATDTRLPAMTMASTSAAFFIGCPVLLLVVVFLLQ